MTSSPANRARITATHSSSRRVRVALSGHGAPVMCSLEYSPVPSATHRRSREHLGERRRGLGDDRRVVALPGRVDDAERQRRRGHRRAEPRPGEPGLPLPRAPRREVVRRHRRVEPGLLGAADGGEQLAGGDLLVRGVPADDRHGVSPCPSPASLNRHGGTRPPQPDHRATGRSLRGACTPAGAKRHGAQRARPHEEHARRETPVPRRGRRVPCATTPQNPCHITRTTATPGTWRLNARRRHAARCAKRPRGTRPRRVTRLPGWDVVFHAATTPRPEPVPPDNHRADEAKPAWRLNARRRHAARWRSAHEEHAPSRDPEPRSRTACSRGRRGTRTPGILLVRQAL